MDQGSNKNHSPAYNFTPTVTKFCVMWEGLSLPHDTKFGNCRCKIVDSRSFHSWSLIHGLRWSGLIKVGPGVTQLHILASSCKYLPLTVYVTKIRYIVLKISEYRTHFLFQHHSPITNTDVLSFVNIGIKYLSAWLMLLWLTSLLKQQLNVKWCHFILPLQPKQYCRVWYCIMRICYVTWYDIAIYM